MNRRLFIERFDRVIDIIDKYIIFFVIASSLATFLMHLLFEDDAYYNIVSFSFLILFVVVFQRFSFYFCLWYGLIRRNRNRVLFIITIWVFSIFPFFTLLLSLIGVIIQRDSMSSLIVTINFVWIMVITRFRVKHRETINNVLM